MPMRWKNENGCSIGMISSDLQGQVQA
jgi:hypothetical protein